MQEIQKKKKYPSIIKAKIISEFNRFSAGYLAKKYKINKKTIETWIERNKAQKLPPKLSKEQQNYKIQYEILKEFIDEVILKKKLKLTSSITKSVNIT